MQLPYGPQAGATSRTKPRATQNATLRVAKGATSCHIRTIYIKNNHFLQQQYLLKCHLLEHPRYALTKEVQSLKNITKNLVATDKHNTVIHTLNELTPNKAVQNKPNLKKLLEKLIWYISFASIKIRGGAKSLAGLHGKLSFRVPASMLVLLLW